MTRKWCLIREAISLLLLSALAFLVCNVLLQSWVYSSDNYNVLLFTNKTSQEVFWLSSPGISLKCLIDILATTLLLKSVFTVLNKRVALLHLLKSVSFAYMVFLVQMLLEAFIIKYKWFGVSPDTMQSFSFLSIAFVLGHFNFIIPVEFRYAADVLSTFELLFILVIYYKLSSVDILSKRVIKIAIVVGYLIPLLLL